MTFGWGEKDIPQGITLTIPPPKKGLQRRKAQPCWCRRVNAVLEPALLQLTKQPSTQLLHNTRQRCNQSCCSPGWCACTPCLNTPTLIFEPRSAVSHSHPCYFGSPPERCGFCNKWSFMNLLPRKSRRDGVVAFSKAKMTLSWHSKILTQRAASADL